MGQAAVRPEGAESRRLTEFPQPEGRCILPPRVLGSTSPSQPQCFGKLTDQAVQFLSLSMTRLLFPIQVFLLCFVVVVKEKKKTVYFGNFQRAAVLHLSICLFVQKYQAVGRLAGLEKYVTLDLEVVSSGLTLGVEITKTNK